MGAATRNRRGAEGRVRACTYYVAGDYFLVTLRPIENYFGTTPGSVIWTRCSGPSM
jgi:hypothetical protein